MTTKTQTRCLAAALLLGVCGVGLLLVWKFQERQADAVAAARLKKLGVALEAYVSDFVYLPKASGNPLLSPNAAAGGTVNPRSMLSWRVALLPFLGEEKLFREFHHNEPWDSPHNKELLARMPEVYLNPRMQSAAERSQGLTHWQVFTGKETPMGDDVPLTITAFTDRAGSIVTLFVVEAREPIPWTKPEDLPYSPSQPLPELGDPERRNFLAFFADGKVWKFPAGTDENTVRYMITYTNHTHFILPGEMVLK